MACIAFGAGKHVVSAPARTGSLWPLRRPQFRRLRLTRLAQGARTRPLELIVKGICGLRCGPARRIGCDGSGLHPAVSARGTLSACCAPAVVPPGRADPGSVTGSSPAGHRAARAMGRRAARRPRHLFGGAARQSRASVHAILTMKCSHVQLASCLRSLGRRNLVGGGLCCSRPQGRPEGIPRIELSLP